MHPYLRFRVRARPASTGTLKQPAGGVPGAAGSPLTGPRVRRVLGKALIDRFCPVGRPRCQDKPETPPRGSDPVRAQAPLSPLPSEARRRGPRDLCRLAEVCPYGVLFAASRTPRPPYALFVPPDRDSGAASLELTLYGPAWRLYAWALGALATALQNGVGKERRSWRVDEILCIRDGRSPEPLASGGVMRLPPDLAPDLLDPVLEPLLAPQPVTVSFLSPARLLRDGSLLPGHEQVPFALLIARILDRFVGLYGRESSSALRPEIRSTIEAEAARVPVVEDDTRWLEVPDYSARSRSELLLGGKVGRTVYGEAAARFLPILRVGEILHVGKNTASGCGRIQVDLPAPSAP